MEDLNQKLINWILKVAVATLSAVIGIVVIVLAVGIFLPNEQVDNQQIFAIIGPAFNTVIGAFVGLLGGLTISGNTKKEEPAPTTEAEPEAEPEPDLGPHPDHPDEDIV
jgi:hypothetical protein